MQKRPAPTPFKPPRPRKQQKTVIILAPTYKCRYVRVVVRGYNEKSLFLTLCARPGLPEQIMGHCVRLREVQALPGSWVGDAE